MGYTRGGPTSRASNIPSIILYDRPHPLNTAPTREDNRNSDHKRSSPRRSHLSEPLLGLSGERPQQAGWQHLKGNDENNDHLLEMRINRQNISHFRFADAYNPRAASRMIRELVEMCGKVGLQMNTNKTRVMRNKFASKSPVNITHNNATIRIEELNEYVYLGRLLNQNNELEPELHR
uniref:Reverse transcriptase domain-containing protein n=1 Tax=Caenorhabditis japonica TaxID=281687 RepID=A0A8R1E6D4_CAEJA